MITGKVIETKLTGLTSTFSDYDCVDGNLQVCHNMVNNGAGLQPITSPAILKDSSGNPLPDISGFEGLMFTHKTSNGTNYIARVVQDFTSGVTKLYWWRDGKASWTFLESCNPDNIELTAVGNILIVNDKVGDGITYIKWDAGTDSYKSLGSNFPDISLDFKLKFNGTNRGSGVYVYTPLEKEVQYIPTGDGDIETNNINMSAAVMAEVNKIINEAKKNSLFMRPFFIRYAYRLYDESYAMVSSPILMLPQAGANPAIMMWDKTFSSTSKSSYLKANIRYYEMELLFKNLDSNFQTLMTNWSDIIQGIDFFITSPIYNFSETGNLVFPSTSFTHDNWYKPDNCERGLFGSGIYSEGSGTCNKKAAFDMLGAYAPTGDRTPMLLLLPERKGNERAWYEEQYLFYKIKSYKVDEISSATEWTQVTAETGLEALETFPTLSDGYRERSYKKAQNVISYNSRLNIANVDIKEFGNFPKAFFNPFSEGSLSGKAKVYIQDNGTWNVTETNFSNMDALLNMNGYFFYPNANAKWLEVAITGGSTYYMQLKQHSFLYGAYYFNGAFGFSNATTDKPDELENVTASSWIHQTNYLYTSNVDNPFVFPAIGVTAIGSGNIIGISTATKAMSEGTSFGQHPLYAFCDDGIWALQVSTGGTVDAGFFTSAAPVSREVPNSKDSVLQIDNSVIFLCERGLMQLTGSTTKLLSEDLQGRVSSITVGTALPRWSDIHSKFFDGTPHKYLEAYNFMQYIKDAKLAFDYANYRIYIYRSYDANDNSSHTAFVYNIGAKTWSTADSTMRSSVIGYPSTYINIKQDTKTVIGMFSKDTTTLIDNGKCFYVTRPIKFQAPDVYKTVRKLIERSVIKSGNTKYIALYGSRDMLTWEIIGAKVGDQIPRISGHPYKAYIVAGWSKLDASNVISRVTMEMKEKYTNRLR